LRNNLLFLITNLVFEIFSITPGGQKIIMC